MSKINIMALGGLDEKNKNLYVLEIDSKMYVLDAGIYEPLNDNFGIQHLIPRLDYIVENSTKVKGIFLSTANRQQIGAITQIARSIPNIKIYGSEVTIEAIKIFYPESKDWNLQTLSSEQKISLDGITVEPILVSSSIPGTFGYVFKTGSGNVIYMTDYIFDYMEEFNNNASFAKLTELSKEKNLLFLSDSMNMNIDSSISPKYKISKFIKRQLDESKKRIVASVYEDEIINIVELLILARQYKRKVFFHNKQIFELISLLISREFIQPFQISLFDGNNDINNSIVIITGTRSDLYPKLQQIIIAEEGLKIKNDDIVFLASPPQPGNEHVYAEIANELTAIDPTVVEAKYKEKLSIHPSQFDLKNFLMFLKPKFFMPIKGYYKEFLLASDIANSMGISRENIILADNGEIFSFDGGTYQGLTRKIKEVGHSIIQGVTDSDIELDVIKDRETLASEGLVTIGFIVNKETKKIKSNIDIQMRGVIFIKTQDKLMTDISDKIKEIIDTWKEEWIKNRIQSIISKDVSKMIKAATKKAPYVVIQFFEQ